MDKLYFVDLVFRAKHEIKSLPDFYGPRFSAWFRTASRALPVEFEDFCLGILPFRDGCFPHIKRGDFVKVRLIIGEKGLDVIPLFLNRLVQTAVEEAQFSSTSFDLVEVIDPVSGKTPTLRDSSVVLSEFNESLLTKELTVIKYLKYFTVDFISPLSLLLPPGTKKFDQPEIFRLCREDFFRKFDNGLLHFANSVRFYDKSEPNSFFSVPKVFSGELEWNSLKYNKDRKVPMGGLIGYIKAKNGLPDMNLLERLVFGQYTGIGKKPRFGLGFYKIRELDCVRDILLPKTDYLLQGQEYRP